MNNIQHLVISLLAGSIYLSLTGNIITLDALIPWIVGGVLVDLDHFFTYGFKNKTINILGIAKLILVDYKANNQQYFLFHTIEFLLFAVFIVVKTGLSWQYIYSYLLHLTCDGFRMRRKSKNYRWLKKWSFSLGYLFRD